MKPHIYFTHGYYSQLSFMREKKNNDLSYATAMGPSYPWTYVFKQEKKKKFLIFNAP